MLKRWVFIKGLNELLRKVGREQGYQKIHFWGVLFDHEGKGTPPMWCIERIEFLKGVYCCHRQWGLE